MGARSDGSGANSDEIPTEGHLFRLDPSLTDWDFEQRWNVTSEWAKRVARALQRYGMFNGDNGGDMAISFQALGRNKDANDREWNSKFPGMIDQVDNIPTNMFRVIYTEETLGARLIHADTVP